MIGVIGGSGIYNLDNFEIKANETIDTPFGAPSDKVMLGSLNGAELAFIPRHGQGHRLLPHEVPYRANVFALKKLGAKALISVSAVGSMRQEIHPGDILIPDQFIDRTMGRASTFFGDGLVGHVSVSDPVSPTLVSHFSSIIKETDVKCHTNGTYVCIQGPAFSTRAESELYRDWNVHVIGMTACPEFKLAREAQLHYMTLALVTDYDCWHSEEEDVSAESVVQTVKKNSKNVKKILSESLPGLSEKLEPIASLDNALMSDPALLTSEQKELLAILKS